MSQPIAVRLPDDLAQRLDTLSQRTRRPRAVYIREALERQIDRIEWEQRILQESEDIRAGRSTTHSEEEVRRVLGMAR